MGVAPAPLPMRSWTPERWAGRVEDLLGDPGYEARARAVAHRLRAEDGVARAVEVLEATAAAGTRG